MEQFSKCESATYNLLKMFKVNADKELTLCETVSHILGDKVRLYL